MLADAIDRMKTSKDDRALIAVGGGSILVPDQIPGINEVVRPEHFDAANAVGAAIASVSSCRYGTARRGSPSAARPAATALSVSVGTGPPNTSASRWIR